MLHRSVAALAVLVSLGATACVVTSCVAEGTLVETPTGPRPIEALAVGDEVIVCDPTTGETAVRRLSSVLRHELRPTFVIDAGSAHLRVTAEHPIWVINKRAWVLAALVSVGDVLLVLHGGALRERRVEALRNDELCVTVYDLSVDGDEHNFFADGVLVHNKEPGCQPDSACGASGPRTPILADASVVDDASLDGAAKDAGDAARDDGSIADGATGDGSPDAADAAADGPSDAGPG